MMTISKAIDTWRNDLNGDNSMTLQLFRKMTSIHFKTIIILGIPLLFVLLLFV
ncbi:hypothetical protein [Robertmurraya massiliosenegalensis]|uniref:hypothetical protein n=1 Tax=Robertmurraya massiliosenegalensis TaxID=1287657 RepID=UPI0002EB8A16|nr:hypothetical protein [Robertmurraya massiliosenegalensis]